MKKLIISSVIIFSGLVITASAQDKLLELVKEKYNSASTISADISQSAGNSNLSGKIFLKKENKLRVEFKNTTIISDGICNMELQQKREQGYH